MRRAVTSGRDGSTHPSGAEWSGVDWRTHRSGAQWLVVASEFEADALRLGLLESRGLDAALRVGGGPRGRAATSLLPLAERAERLLLRPVRHGGWLGGLRGDRILGPGRATRELAVGAKLLAAGAPVARPVLAAGRRRASHSPFWRIAVGTVYEEGSRDAAAWLASGPGRERLVAGCGAVGAGLRRLHDRGGLHGDLHVGNVLLRETPGAADAIFVDLDRASLGEPPTARTRMAEIMRLERSLEKRRLARRVGRDGRRAFLDAYCAGDVALLESLRARIPHERRRIALHALLWRGGEGA